MGIYYKDSTGKVHNFSSSLPIASKNGLGVIQVGENLEITEEGILNAQATSNVHYGTTEPTDDGIVMWINPEGDEDEVYLTTTNTIEYTPTGDYNPATKKYVDDKIIDTIYTLEIDDEDWDNITIEQSLSIDIDDNLLNYTMINVKSININGDYAFSNHVFVLNHELGSEEDYYLYFDVMNSQAYRLYVGPNNITIWLLREYYTKEEVNNKLETMFVDLQPVEEIQ